MVAKPPRLAQRSMIHAPPTRKSGSSSSRGPRAGNVLRRPVLPRPSSSAIARLYQRLSDRGGATMVTTPVPPRRTLSLLWLIAAAPGLYQVALLAVTVARRLLFPYDLEWMEGGMLNHALRLAEGQPIYAPPSIDFVPYLYTPLYPALLAWLGKVFGLTYQLGRAVS